MVTSVILGQAWERLEVTSLNVMRICPFKPAVLPLDVTPK